MAAGAMAKLGVGLLLSMVVISLVLSHASGLSREDYQEMKKRLKFLNRPSVKSIQTDYGDTFDCVDINKQATLDHPLLKNHTIQLKPEFIPEGMKETPSNQILHPKLKIGSCPHGTVPIRRTKMADLLRADSLSRFGKIGVDANDGIDTGSHWAIVERRGTFYGAKANLNVWNPQVKGRDFSNAAIWVSNDSAKRNTILAGWNSDNYQNTGCFNNECSGFVQVSKDVALGVAISPVSSFDGEQREIEVVILRDSKSGNWWLKIQSFWVGYWPNALFTTLDEKATFVQWGGIISKRTQSNATPMGSGRAANLGFRESAYVRKMMTINAANTLDHAANDISYIADVPRCYNSGYGGFDEDDWGSFFYYGGSGVC